MSEKKDTQPTPPSSDHTNGSLPVLAMVFGVLSLTGFGFIFGIPAIILATMALKKNLPERGLSITGLVTGIISTVLSVLFAILVLLALIWGTNHPEEIDQPSSHGRGTEQRFESSQT